MKALIRDTKLILQHVPGNGAWTYHIVIPGTKDLPGKWGDIKVSGTIDGYPFRNMNLAPVTGKDKRMSVNADIRKAIGKAGGDEVCVTMWLISGNRITDGQVILDCFNDAGVLSAFNALRNEERCAMLDDILSRAQEADQERRIVSYIVKLSSLK